MEANRPMFANTELHKPRQHGKDLTRNRAGWRYHPYEVSVSGFSGSGKTTLITTMIKALKERGLQSAYMKHDAHKFIMDKEGKDTHRAYQAGAERVAIRDHQHTAIIARGNHDQAVLEQNYLLNDVLLIEGNKLDDLPKFFLLDPRNEGLAMLEEGRVQNLLAIIGTGEQISNLRVRDVAGEVPLLERNETDSILTLLMDYLRSCIPPVSALLLVGGRSLRMGEDKADIAYHGRSQAEYMVELLGRFCPRVFVSVDEQVPGSLREVIGRERILPDRFRNFGPIGGILTAFQERPQDSWLVNAVDLPYLTEADIQHLMNERNPYNFATCYGTTMPEPLCAIYEPKAASRMLALLGRGINCPRGFLMNTPHKPLSPLHANSMTNANSPTERQEVFRDMSARHKGETSQSAPDDGLMSVHDLEQCLELLRQIIISQKRETEYLPLNQSRGRRLAQPIYADRDQPPFNRAAMDGIALRAEDLQKGQRDFPILGVLAAGGSVEQSLIREAACIEIMTGAAVPEGYDTVLQYELLHIENSSAHVRNDSRAGMNIHPQAADYQKGDLLLEKGSEIHAPAVAILATAGLAEVPVQKQPHIAIVSTGSELVSISELPRENQIRRSNVHALAAELAGWGQQNISIHHFGDNEEEILTGLEKILSDSSVLILSGGVSRGKFDHVPQVLHNLGVEVLAQRIRQKPGKPLLLGQWQNKVPVFALPGNPVSALINLRRYLVPMLVRTPELRAPLAVDIPCKEHYTHYCAVHWSSDRTLLPIENNGSGDFFHLKNSSGFVQITRANARKGSFVNFFPWSGSDHRSTES